MPSTSRPWASPDQVGWCAISAVHCVNARTKTRSKKSSSGVTCSRSRRVAPSRGWPPSGIFGAVSLEQTPLFVVLGEEEEHERRAERDRREARSVGPLVSMEEGCLRGGDDLFAVARVLLGEVGGARERLGQLAFDVFGDASLFRGGCDRSAGGCGVAGGEEGAKDRLHDCAAQVTLEVGGAGCHPGAPYRDRPGQRVRRRSAGKADSDSDQRIPEADLPIGDAFSPEQQH